MSDELRQRLLSHIPDYLRPEVESPCWPEARQRERRKLMPENQMAFGSLFSGI